MDNDDEEDPEDGVEEELAENEHISRSHRRHLNR